MWSDRFDPYRDRSGGVKHKLKVVDQYLEHSERRRCKEKRKISRDEPPYEHRKLFKKEPLYENKKSFRYDPPYETRKLFKKEKEPLDETKKLYKIDHPYENKTLHKNDPPYENRKLHKIDPPYENRKLHKNDPPHENRKFHKINPPYENKKLHKNDHPYENKTLHKYNPPYENRKLHKIDPSYENKKLHKNDPPHENRKLQKNDHPYENKKLQKNDPPHENRKLRKKDPLYDNRKLFKTDPLYDNKKLFKTDPLYDNKKLFKTDPLYDDNRKIFKKEPSDDLRYNSVNHSSLNDNMKTFKREPLDEPRCNSVNNNSLNDNNIYKTNKYFDINKQNSSKNQYVKSNESNCDNVSNVNKNRNNESDNYMSISDNEFQLEKNKNEINNDLNSIANSNEITPEESNKTNSNLNVSNYRLYSNNIDNDEVYELLDKSYQEKTINPNTNKKIIVTKDDFKEYEKTVLEEVCINHFDILPENWIQATHKSGMPIYLHKKSRVVTLSRPYFLGPGDPKSHLAPLSAITCLQYRKGLETKERQKNEPDFQMSKLGDMIIPNAKVETAQENIIRESLTHDELRKYCQSLFKLQDAVVPIEKTQKQNLSSGNLFTHKNTKERPSLPDSTKLISFPVQSEDHDKKCTRRREWIMNPNGKSYVSILHEYLQQALKTQPWYDFKELENSETPYSAIVVLNDVQYGVGFGNSKKQAKLKAAQATLDILIPEMKNKIDKDQRNNRDPVIFDQIKVTDPRITEFCAKTTEPSPYAMLLVCLQRNFGECEVHIDYKLNNRRRMLNQCTMTVGKHTASVACKNKRDGKQKASQVILGQLHPHIDNWGSLLRLYGNRSIKNAKEKKQEEQEITQLQSKAAVNQPNYAILNKLKEEMLKIRNKRESIKSSDTLPYSMLVSACPYTIAIPSPIQSPIRSPIFKYDYTI